MRPATTLARPGTPIVEVESGIDGIAYTVRVEEKRGSMLDGGDIAGSCVRGKEGEVLYDRRLGRRTGRCVKVLSCVEVGCASEEWLIGRE